MGKTPTPKELQKAAKARLETAAKNPSAEELREAARRRDPNVPRYASASSYFEKSSGTRSYGVNSRVLPAVRISENLAKRLGEWGNAHMLNQSDTIRHLLVVALDQEEARNG